MNVEIDEKDIKDLIEIEVKKITTDVIAKTVQGWGFEEKIKAVVRKEMDAVIQEVVNEQSAEIGVIRKIVHDQMVKRCKSQLDKAMRISRGEL